ncbi:MAG: hypothetical protein WD205_11960 [Rhodothermales bacterium]
MSRIQSSDRSARTRHDLFRLAFWTAGWVLTMAVATFGPEFMWSGNTILTVVGIALNLAVGVGMIVANMRHVQELDEMMQRVQLEAMGIALGIGIVGGLSYSLLDVTNLIGSDAEIAHLVILISIAYVTTLVVAMRRYR